MYLRILVMASTCAGFSILSAMQAEETAKPNKEPPQQFYLEVDGKKVSISLDESLPLEKLAGAKNATLRVQPFRVFEYGGLKFHYPRQFVFDAEETADQLWVWTLTGNDAMIMTQHFPTVSDADELTKELIESLVDTYGTRNSKTSKTSWLVDKQKLNGTMIDVRLADAQLRQEIYVFQSGPGCVAIVLQDAPKVDGSSTAEFLMVRGLLTETMQLPVEK